MVEIHHFHDGFTVTAPVDKPLDVFVTRWPNPFATACTQIVARPTREECAAVREAMKLARSARADVIAAREHQRRFWEDAIDKAREILGPSVAVPPFKEADEHDLAQYVTVVNFAHVVLAVGDGFFEMTNEDQDRILDALDRVYHAADDPEALREMAGAAMAEEISDRTPLIHFSGGWREFCALARQIIAGDPDRHNPAFVDFFDDIEQRLESYAAEHAEELERPEARLSDLVDSLTPIPGLLARARAALEKNQYPEIVRLMMWAIRRLPSAAVNSGDREHREVFSLLAAGMRGAGFAIEAGEAEEVIEFAAEVSAPYRTVREEVLPAPFKELPEEEEEVGVGVGEGPDSRPPSPLQSPEPEDEAPAREATGA